ncbi:MAG TPA: GAF domain-containing protein [Blastocatellia bacterium]|nr:GAF domain-containing protein [Blastocatellia bacterium]
MVEQITQQANDTSERLGRIYELALTVAGNPIEVFDHIVRIIAELLGVRVAIVERLDGDRIVTLSMYLEGKILHEGVFDLAGTPCADVRETRSFCAFNSAAERFPQDHFLRDYGIEFYIGVPVVSTSGEVIAIINAMSDRAINLTNEDKLFLQAMASRVRLELERADQAIEARALRALLDISVEISRFRKLEETLHLVVENTKSLLGVDIAAVATLDDSAGTTSWKAMSGFRSDAFLRTTFAPGRGTAGRAVAARQTVVLEGIGQNPDLPAEEFPIHIAEGINNGLGVPLMVGERVVGVLIAGYREGRKPGKHQIRFAEAIAGQAAVAIENARLFSELATANERLLKADHMKTEMIAELSTPVIPIWERVLLAPIIGTLTSDRSARMTDALLEKTSAGGADVVILDITGVRTIDTEAAQHLRNTVTAVRVLGARCIITGIRASVAQTLVHLGITLDDIETRRKLSDALHLAISAIEGNR